MAFDYSSLTDRMKEKHIAKKELAKKVGISESHFVRKLSGEFSFKQEEIAKICTILEIEAENIPRFFFCQKS